MRVVADLHTHSLASDGQLSPVELVGLAASRGLKALALTDHDTLAGIPPAGRYARDHGLRLIPGVEVSAEHTPGMLHILGYFPSFPDGLEDDLAQVQRARRERIPKIIGRLNDLGITISGSDVMPAGTGAQPGRPHVARALLKKGYVGTFDEAFDTYLGTGRPAYVPKEMLTRQRAVSLIRHHGGLPVLAHPYSLDLDDLRLRSFLEQLCSEGLGGVEIHYPEHTPGQTHLYGDMASALGLVVTGGSDYHGPERNGFMPGDCGIDHELFDSFCKHLML